jgi:hypothetical protein
MKKLTCFLFAVISAFVASAQKDFKHDTNYYETFPDKITGRIYFSQKYVHLNFPPKGNGNDLEYKANHNLNLGLGVTINKISINLFYGFSFLNNKDSAKGETKGLDLQLHAYPRKWAVDIYGVFPKGFYLDPKGYASSNLNAYYHRPDLKLSLLGISAYYVPNKEQFSYRAAITQTQWQKKSAGSILFGGEIYSGKIKGDSAIIPKAVQSGFPQAGLTKVNFICFGPGVGYAHTFVIEQHLFLTGSLVGNLNATITTEQGATKTSKFSISPAEVFKVAAGYNSSNWSVAVNWTGNGVWFKGPSSPEHYFWPSGNYRLILSKKFDRKKHA